MAKIVTIKQLKQEIADLTAQLDAANKEIAKLKKPARAKKTKEAK